MKIKFRFFALLAIFGLLFSGSGYLYAQAQPRNLTQAEWQLMLDRINLLVDNHFQNRDFDEGQNANWNIAGLSVGVYHNGRTAIFSRGYHESQQRNVRNRTPVTEDSIFAIGSVSKVVSAIMASYFSRINNPATGRPYINLNDPVNNYFPTRPFIDTNGTAVHPTLIQFITHLGGVPRHLAFDNLAAFKAGLANQTYVFKPGTAYNYSMGTAVVANIVASLYYNDFPQRKTNDLLSEHLFRPLGMSSTRLQGWGDPAMRERMALSHRFNGAARNDFLSVPSDTLIGASGEITSTARDMMRLAAFILGDGVPRGSEVLQQAAAAGLAWNKGSRSVPNTALSPHESNVSTLGGRFRELFTRPANPGRYGSYLYHGGAIGGHQTTMIICPDTKTAVVVLVNNQETRGTLYAQIMDRVLNATYSGSGRRTVFDDFDDRVASYVGANANVDIALNESFTITVPMNNIRAPARAGATLTIRSADPSRPVTLTSGVTGDLFTVPSGATLIFRDIIIDSGANIIFSKEDNIDEYDEDGNLVKPPETVADTLVRVNPGGTFSLGEGAVLRINIDSSYAGGVRHSGASAVFTMRGGRISYYTSNTSIDSRTPDGGYGLILRRFEPGTIFAAPDELFDIRCNFENPTSDIFKGHHFGAGLFDDKGNLVEVIGVHRPSSQMVRREIANFTITDCKVSGAVKPGKYRLRLLVMPDGLDWRIASVPYQRTPTEIDFTVKTIGQETLVETASISTDTASSIKVIAGSYGLTIEKFPVNKTSLSQNELLAVTPTIRNTGSDTFPSGQIGMALENNNGGIVEIIGITNFASLQPNKNRSNSIVYCAVPNTVRPGQYRLRMVVRPTGGEWGVASQTVSGVPNTIPITITAGEAMVGGYGVALTQFAVDNRVSAVSQGQRFSISARVAKAGVESFLGGQFGVALVGSNGNIVEVIYTTDWKALEPGAERSMTINCTMPNSVAPGNYRLRAVVRPPGGEWRIATMSASGVPNSIDFTVR
jgi:CubicO group peptidase (beta-lactamase class C family)